MWICGACRHLARARFDQCPGCRSWSTCRRPTVDELKLHDEPARFAPTLADVAPANPGRIVTGLADWDQAFGGGIAQGSLAMVWGKPGTGKTTELLRIVGAVGGCYGTSEGGMTPEMLRTLADRAAIDPSQIIPCRLERPSDIAAMLRYRPRVAVVDSIQGFQLDDMGDLKSARRIMRDIVRVWTDVGSTIIVVCHAGREGRAGPSRFDHDVETTIVVRTKSLRVSKNRWGAFPISVVRSHGRVAPRASHLRAVER